MKFTTAAFALLAASFAVALPAPMSDASPTPTSEVVENNGTPEIIGKPTAPDHSKQSGKGKLSSGKSSGNGNGKSSTSKRGISYNNAGLTHLFPADAVSWTYNWASKPGNAAKAGEYVPMLFNGDNPTWAADVESALKSGSKHLLAMNEPDQPTSAGGTSLSPQQAAQLYKSKMNPYKGKARLGAPAVSAGGIPWLQEFAAACNGGCHIDFVPLHFYDYSHPAASDQATSFKNWLKETIPQVRSMFKDQNLPIWVTEFAAVPLQPLTDATSVAYMNDVLPFLEGNAAVARYSYFFADALASVGKLNAAGKRYVQHKN